MSSTDAVRRALAAAAAESDQSVVISTVPGAEAWADTVDAHDGDMPLRGIALAVKDNIDVQGAATTAGCPSFGVVADRSATVIERLLAAGAVPALKTNLDQFATGLVGTRTPYGVARNPFDPSLVPGGSSSGSAVAVALGIVDASLGTDTAGSGRVPAAMCGIVGLKPTRGWLSCAGVVPAVRSIDCVSVFAGDVDTAWRVTLAAGGFDAEDPMSRTPRITPRAAVRRVGRIGTDVLAALDTDPAIVAGYESACAAFVDAGVDVVTVDPSALFEIGDLLYGGSPVSERFAAVGEFIAARPAGLDPTVTAIIEESTRWTAVDAHRTTYRLAELQHEVDALFALVDLLVTPTITFHATVEAVRAEPRAVNTRLGRFTTFSNLAGLCALTLPFGPSERPDRPPTSITLHGPAWCDETLVRAAALIGRSATSVAEPPTGWIRLAVAGAHLRGQPLEWQLTDRDAVWLGTTSTSPDYRLVALPDTTPPKPGLARVREAGASIEVDLWALRPDAFGDFVDAIPAPLCIGTVELAEGTSCAGFLCEPVALDGATDITRFGGWRSYIASRA